MIINARSVEQSQLARCTIALGIAQQWFGHFIRPATPDDAWLVEGKTGSFAALVSYLIPKRCVLMSLSGTHTSRACWLAWRAICEAISGADGTCIPAVASQADYLHVGHWRCSTFGMWLQWRDTMGPFERHRYDGAIATAQSQGMYRCSYI